jgi:hypothetical protein
MSNSYTATRLDVEGSELTLEFRLAVNGVIVNTLVDGTPLVTTSAGFFN